MSSKADAPAEEIIIVRRKSGGEDDCHHGGVWKIAYADFMTAMMAFFLVMWLINAANTEVKASVASYFNPLRLTDTATRKRGLRDLDEKEKSKSNDKSSQEGSEAQGKGEAAGHAEPSKKSSSGIDNAKEERHRLALNFDKTAPATKREEHAARSSAATQAGRAFRDPFNPMSPSQMVDADRNTPGKDRSGKPAAKPRIGPMRPENDEALVDRSNEGSEGVWSKSLKKKTEEGVALAKAAAEDAMPPDSAGKESAPQATNVQNAKAAADPHVTADNIARAEKMKRMEETVGKVHKSVANAIAKFGAAGGPGMDVAIEGDSVVLSLTDTSTFGMFAVGSSDPKNELVGLIKSIAPILRANAERIIVRGHTDGRQFRSEGVNNNWRLSTMRAEAAYELLLSAGIEEGRFARIEGHADRRLKDAADPQSAVNRRIEILLKQADG